MKIIERWKKSLYRKAIKHRLIAPQVIVVSSINSIYPLVSDSRTL